MKQNYIEKNPASKLPRWKDTPKYVHIPQEQGVIRALDVAVNYCESNNAVKIRDGLIFMLAVYSGCRRDEIRNLPLKDVQKALLKSVTDVYRIYTTGKTGDAILRFTSDHVPYLRKYLAIRPYGSRYLFVNVAKNSPYFGEQLSLVSFNRVRWKICKDARIDVITYQELRRRLATIIARSAGVDVAAQALNHSPHTGDRVIRLFYYNPDLEAVDKATGEAWQSLKG